MMERGINADHGNADKTVSEVWFIWENCPSETQLTISNSLTPASLRVMDIPLEKEQ